MPETPPKRKRGNPTWSAGGAEHRPPRGAGWGGDASGSPAAPASATHRLPPKGTGSTARELAIQHREEMLAIIVAIARSETATEQTRLDAANKVLNRSDGTPAASVDLTSGGGPLTVVLRRFVDSPPDEV